MNAQARSADAGREDLRQALIAMRLVRPDERPVFTALPGGVSSEILRVDCTSGAVCIKRALPVLKVSQHWEAPIERNRYEADYFELVGGFAPDNVPKLLGRHDPSASFAMEWLDPGDYALWKSDLLAGRADTAVACSVGRALANIHGRTARWPGIDRRFDTGPIFHALRLEPYLEATAQVHDDLAPVLLSLSARTRGTEKVLVHGDVSPKNIMVGPNGPVFLDAECAWFGDPAFDIAFCLNHLLLKAAYNRARNADYLACFGALAGAYLDGVDWEPRDDVEDRTATLLPGLGLARIDGKSPVEYLVEKVDKDRVRAITRALLQRPVRRLDDVADAWRKGLA